MLFKVDDNFIEAKTHRSAYLKNSKYIYDTIMDFHRAADDAPAINPKTDLLFISEDNAEKYFHELINSIAGKLSLKPVPADICGGMVLVLKKTDSCVVSLRVENCYSDIYHLAIVAEDKLFGCGIKDYLSNIKEDGDVDELVAEIKINASELAEEYKTYEALWM